MKIDSHIHFWKYHPIKDAWITEEMKVLQQDFMPTDLLPQMQTAGIAHGVLVQADQSEQENDFLLAIANQHDAFKAVVGWVDLRSPKVEDRLAYYNSLPLMKGFRHIVQAEPDQNFLLQPAFSAGIEALAKYDFTYDVLIYPKHLDVAYPFCKKHSQQKLLIDHLAKPNFKTQDLQDWKRKIKVFQSMDHVYCKLVGLSTEADWHHWKQEDFTAALDICLEVFGPKRLMFGSDWPVCKVAAEYPAVIDIINQHIVKLSADEQAQIWSKTCQEFYNINL